MSDNKKIAVIGSPDIAVPFRSIGAESFEVSSSEELAETLRKVAQEDAFGIVFVEEGLAASVMDVVASVNDRHRGVAITVIPGTTGESGVALQRLSSQVTRAIGIDIFAQRGGN